MKKTYTGPRCSSKIIELAQKDPTPQPFPVIMPAVPKNSATQLPSPVKKQRNNENATDCSVHKDPGFRRNTFISDRCRFGMSSQFFFPILHKGTCSCSVASSSMN